MRIIFTQLLSLTRLILTAVKKRYSYNDTGSLQIFNGTLTEITCLADVPVYRLMDHKGEYDSYNDFPGLFGIEARLSPTEDSVTLYINGTNRSNNVTVICRNVDVSSGTSFSTLFILILEFVGRFINLIRLINRFIALYMTLF